VKIILDLFQVILTVVQTPGGNVKMVQVLLVLQLILIKIRLMDTLISLTLKIYERDITTLHLITLPQKLLVDLCC
jgi:hypothetical protein